MICSKKKFKCLHVQVIRGIGDPQNFIKKIISELQFFHIVRSALLKQMEGPSRIEGIQTGKTN